MKSPTEDQHACHGIITAVDLVPLSSINVYSDNSHHTLSCYIYHALLLAALLSSYLLKTNKKATDEAQVMLKPLLSWKSVFVELPIIICSVMFTYRNENITSMADTQHKT